MFQIYKFISGAIHRILPLYLALKDQSAENKAVWAARRGQKLPEPFPGCLWLHGSSVGEVGLLELFTEQLQSQGIDSLAGSCFTSTGFARLQKVQNLQRRFYLPLDFPGLPTSLSARLQPRSLALIETEIWPNLVHELSQAKVSVCMLNARLAPEAMKKYKALKPLYRNALQRMTFISCQSEADRDRFLSLGANSHSTSVDGNAKADKIPIPISKAEARATLLSSADTPWFVAGSTAPEEDLAMVDCWQSARLEIPKLQCVLAPRHLDRIPNLVNQLEAKNVRPALFSKVKAGSSRPEDSVVVLDTFGDLESLYAAASVAFVGGSLAPVGGHNPLEPAMHSVPVLVGPHTSHTGGLAEALIDAQAALRVTSTESLTKRLIELLKQEDQRRAMGAKGKAWISSQRGAVARQCERWLTAIEAQS